MNPSERLPQPASPALDLTKLKLRSRAARAHKVSLERLGKPTAAGASFADWFASLPGFLGAAELRAAVRGVVAARLAGKPVLFAFGGHIVKTGCSPLVIDLMERGVITAIATNGSGAIHDLELAETGETSEEVAETIRDGSFGMVNETCERMNQAAREGRGVGLGRALGNLLQSGGAAHRELSLFAAAARLNIPATVHVAIGTDTVHMHPAADGAALGEATLADFRNFCQVVAAMGEAPSAISASRASAGAPSGASGLKAGGVFLNFGSAVIMPEVFLKAVSIARNLGYDLDGMRTANFDMLRHYRPAQNVVSRPVKAGHGNAVTGHHEILLPLFRQAIVEEVSRCEGRVSS